MSSRFIDRFDRVDGEIGSNYLVPCGGVALRDESIIPVDTGEIVSGVSPILDNTTDRKTQVLYNAEVMDSPDQVIRATWAHDDLTPSGTSDPSFSVIARMSKDPLLEDLGSDEDPFCYDQGYGLRVTCPRLGTAPILKLIKFSTVRRAPNLPRDTAAEVDGAIVLTSVTLQSDDLNIDPDWDETGNFPYRGNWQEVRLRIRRSEDQVVLDAYLNDRHLNTAILTYTDRRDPLWGVIGLPGFDFISPTLAIQPVGTSPFSLQGEAIMRCGLFQVETIKDFRRPVSVTPSNFFTYDEVTKQAITIVEKNGDARYNATASGQTKMATYLQFVLDAEAHIIRKEGYFDWLRRASRIYLVDGRSEYELPEDTGLIEFLRPGNWQGVPLRELRNHLFRQRLGGITQTSGNPTVYTLQEESVNNRPVVSLFPIPSIAQVTDPTQTDDPYMVVEYYARRLRPSEPDRQIPYVPQEHIDVLIWGAAAHALLLDTDPSNSQAVAGVFESKLGDLRRENNRKDSSRQTVAQSAADVLKPNVTSRIPLLRATQLETLLI